MNNRKMGNGFEAEFCQMLFDCGFFVHNLAQNQAGQPADVIAVRGKRSILADCKVCSSKGFPLSRIEPNQWSAMGLWGERSYYEAIFVLRLMDKSIWMLSYNTMLDALLDDIPRFSEEQIRSKGMSFEQWMEVIDREDGDR